MEWIVAAVAAGIVAVWPMPWYQDLMVAGWGAGMTWTLHNL